MPHVSDLIAGDEIKKLSRLQFLARHVVEGSCSGMHRSPHKGFSVEFKEHRAYVSGDEVRTIDWKLYAKTDRLYIREFEEETNLRCTLLVDSSGSMLKSDARKLGQLKELQTVVVKGTASRDDKGNLTVLASGIYVKK